MSLKFRFLSYLWNLDEKKPKKSENIAKFGAHVDIYGFLGKNAARLLVEHAVTLPNLQERTTPTHLRNHMEIYSTQSHSYFQTVCGSSASQLEFSKLREILY